MCGIVGVLGNHEVAPILVEALKRLEYRGYIPQGSPRSTTDGWTAGARWASLSNLSDLVSMTPCPQIRHRHTRWATHGAARW